VSRQVDSKLVKVSKGDLNNIQKVLDETKKMTEEEKDIEGRSNNIIMEGIPESRTAKNLTKYDKSFSLELFKGVIELDVQEEDLKSIFRLGKCDPNSTGRPLLVLYYKTSFGITFQVKKFIS
jgi:23S rRNA maturation mini-RNase III